MKHGLNSVLINAVIASLTLSSTAITPLAAQNSWQQNVNKAPAVNFGGPVKTNCTGPFETSGTTSNVYVAKASRNRRDNCVEIQIRGTRSNQVAIVDASLNMSAPKKKAITLTIFNGTQSTPNSQLCASTQTDASSSGRAAAFVSCSLNLSHKQTITVRAVTVPQKYVGGTGDFTLRLSVRVQSGRVIELSSR